MWGRPHNIPKLQGSESFRVGVDVHLEMQAESVWSSAPFPPYPALTPLLQHVHCCCCSLPKSCPTLATPWTVAHQAPLSFSVSRSLLKFMSTESVMPSDHLIFCCPLLLLPSIFPSNRVFSNEWALRLRWPKYWSFSFRISPSKEYSGLISFRIDWFDLFACPRDSQESSPIWNHQFFGAWSSLWSKSHICTWLLKKP